MKHVMLRPDLRTAGGEVSDILYKNRFVGTLTLVYRESDRIAGALQLEKEVLSEDEKEEVFEDVHMYVEALVDAMQARACEVMVTYSSYDHVIATEAVASAHNRAFNSDWVDYGTRLEDEHPNEREEYTMADYEMVVVGEDDDSVEYHVYDKNEDWVAEALLKVEDRSVIGTVDWLIEPAENELDIIADMLVLDFDDNEVDDFVIHMLHQNEIIETIELTHEDLLSDEDPDVFQSDLQSEYSIMLARDDGDVLTYEIYQQSRGGLPIGTATVDISERQLTGFIDFREPGSTDDRELIATLLMEELDKEKDYEAINLSMMHKNRLIEEVLFETEQVH
ncbi:MULTISPECIES: hypothetical protein [unclassified Paenibacillus]|uniref:hypothetical protein n=1 Tax=unclassified Paenibacillus TaxID=185978 RepID=UPI001AE4CC52|nr:MULTISPECIES: hypothetical protein [unclassified Paenibacillus]MBP1154798.1 hypothetical protein [Paenibacillus sp. PvP091]MBP1169818.1 hypothetical protein [Paenibacillus sp. PvR098]MBP2440846.1 hypothetical protein [Paenibacillus sp. PvP052]